MMRRVLGVAEAAVALSAAEVLTRALPFAVLAPLLGPRAAGVAGNTAASAPNPRATAIGLALARAAARLPWKSTCLARAVAGRLMLSRRRIPASVVVGVCKEPGGMRAHAWLVCAGEFVSGGGPHVEDYTAIVAFSDEANTSG